MAANLKNIKNSLSYQPDTGKFYWMETLSSSAPKGNEAGCLRPDGYLIIGINKKSYLAHRLAWFVCYGYFPENDIDHINRNKADNRIVNLREVSRSCNLRNSCMHPKNTSGIKGVRWHNREEKWCAHIFYRNKQRHLGNYKYFDNAVCARLAAEQCLNWAGCDSESPAFKYVRGILI